MNRALGFMNVLLLAFVIIQLFILGGDPEQRQTAMGLVVTFVPITFTMFALEPRARFLRTAIAGNLLLIVLYFLGSGMNAASARNMFLLPFVLNIVWLVRIWFARRRAAREAEYEWANQPDAQPSDAALLPEPIPWPEPSANYFARHWRGELSLPVSYWVNSWGATALLVWLILLAEKTIADISLRWGAAAALSLNTLILAAWVWSVVGAWRSAGNHVSRGGARAWAVVAQVLLVFGVLGTTSNFFLHTLPQMKDHLLIVADRDPMGRVDAQLTRDGHALLVRGPLGAGASAKVRSLLDQAPSVVTIVLDSPGGRIAEGTRIAALVRERKLNTYVEGHCESACTLVFLAGVDRTATALARIGFHRASIPGMTPQLDKTMTESILGQYRAAGLSETFLSRIKQTLADDMWYPTHEELREAHVVTRFSAGGEIARQYDSKSRLAFEYAGDPIMGAINDRFHGAVDAAAAAAWGPYERGASDAEMRAAARKVILGYYAKLLRTADESSLRAYLQIRLDEFRALHEVSDEACAQMANSSLDVRQGLPRDLYARELTWLRIAIEASNQPAAPAVDRGRFKEVMRSVMERISPEAPGPVGDPDAYAGQPALLCRATLEFYEAVRDLPLGDRMIAVRGLFQTSTE